MTTDPFAKYAVDEQADTRNFESTDPFAKYAVNEKSGKTQAEMNNEPISLKEMTRYATAPAGAYALSQIPLAIPVMIGSAAQKLQGMGESYAEYQKLLMNLDKKNYKRNIRQLLGKM